MSDTVTTRTRIERLLSGADDYTDDHEEEPFENFAKTCPGCAAPNLPLGRLGRLLHYSCRMCSLYYWGRPDTETKP